MSNFEVFILVVILVIFGFFIAELFLDYKKDRKDKERVKVNMERCEKCIYCKMSDYPTETIFCEAVDNGAFIEPCENCKYYRASEKRSICEIINMHE